MSIEEAIDATESKREMIELIPGAEAGFLFIECDGIIRTESFDMGKDRLYDLRAILDLKAIRDLMDEEVLIEEEDED